MLLGLAVAAEVVLAVVGRLASTSVTFPRVAPAALAAPRGSVVAGGGRACSLMCCERIVVLLPYEWEELNV